MAVEQETAVKATYLRVRVVDRAKEGDPVVNVRVPIGLVKFGFKMAQRFSPEMKKADLDWDAIAEVIDQGLTGEIAHVEDEAEHKTVDVYVE